MVTPTASLSNNRSNLTLKQAIRSQAIRSGNIFSPVYIGIMLPTFKVRLIRFEKKSSTAMPKFRGNVGKLLHSPHFVTNEVSFEDKII